ncbi:MAG: hypothetical protein LKK00_09340 [Intestinimonas sp.]|jgi:hypothetical protein|nr:hypothetical protein [Intestinimonas sp.]
MSVSKTIQDYKDAYKEAKAKGDSAGMQAANDGANAIRSANGMATQSASQDISNTAATNNGSWIGDSSGGSSSGGGSSADSASYYQGSTAYQPNDYSSYVKDLYSAKTDAALAALKSAYDDNVADVDAAEAKLTPTYQAARNKTAATSDLEKQNFQEYANARGLNSGTSGQAELARSTTLQGNLNDINTQEADARSDLELQRTKLASEYNTAIAQAKANGDYELANALYTEKTRVDNAMSDAADKQATYDYNKWNANYNVDQNAQTRADNLAAQQEQYAREDAATNKETAYNLAMATIQSGNIPSDSILNAAGIDKTAAQYLSAYYKGQVDTTNQQNQLAIQQASSRRRRIYIPPGVAAGVVGVLLPETVPVKRAVRPSQTLQTRKRAWPPMSQTRWTHETAARTGLWSQATAA